jgi:hypothetical protein
MTNILFIFFFIIKFILLEIKNKLSSILGLIKFFNNYYFFNFINYKLFGKKLIFKDNNINIFLQKNYQITSKEKFKKPLKNKILVELLLPHHSEPMMMNCLIAKDLQKVFNSQIVGLINKDDLLTKKNC